jgi:NDP-sugar pyrophosphorylase family protein
MAGGNGTRMSDSGIRVRKPLIRLFGVTLLERNLWMLARAGCRHISIATSAHAAAIEEAFTDDLTRRASSIGITVELLVEQQPRGNFGAVTQLAKCGQPVLVVFSDNLTTLNLNEVAGAHTVTNAALTLAAHKELFRMPYGELQLRQENQEVLAAYVEKPTYEILISSGIAVISAEAIKLIPRDLSIGLSDVSNRLIAAGEPVSIHRHDSPWIDINDSAGLGAAALLIQQNRAAFERWWAGPFTREGLVTLVPNRGSMTPSKWFDPDAMLQNDTKPAGTFDLLTNTGVVRVHAIEGELDSYGGTLLPPDLAAALATRLDPSRNPA